MTSYFDGEEREITEISEWAYVDGKTYYCVYYTRGKEFHGLLLVDANDELDAMRKFPAELERQSQNFNDDVED